ncbi:radical SAM protein [Paenibacillus sp. ACRRX]|uniref:radical SAM/SPASM domain-containing protein n=1 Tax=unclassified Paenibacillus TaxID=185978 RepID=UPI001EF7317E|nr:MULTISPECIES: radical SAM protein [unclassified Paenibacillus]MCG7408149.1 radical SAM protein [Paenibacillus sp. ACRRX]MDK8181468.1 radical SAM protein [Paenibacillus sp. UMB4589-SE434]
MPQSQQSAPSVWKPSRFNAITEVDDGGLVVFNSYSGAIASFSKEEREQVRGTLSGLTMASDPQGLVQHLIEHGFLVQEHTDELQRATDLHQSMNVTDTMHLVLLSTEACSFRCNYCYETFPRGRMENRVITGLKHYVQQKAATLQHLHISWHGGEPLLAWDVIAELSTSFMEAAEAGDMQYSADIATNGYYLTVEKMQQLLGWNVNRFMITVDGPAEVHDQRRSLAGGGGTYERIMSNLIALQATHLSFDIHIRINFDNSTLQAVEAFIPELARQFAGDERFKVYPRPVGCMGGENDLQLPVCDDRTKDERIWSYNEQVVNEGLQISSFVSEILVPGGAVCYAAKPNSLIVGSDGKLYKCSVAIEEEYNQLGYLDEEGQAHIDLDKMLLWTTSGEEKDENCQACFFRPACQGNHCPLYRMRTGNRPCSYEKRQIKKTLRTIWLQEEAVTAAFMK